MISEHVVLLDEQGHPAGIQEKATVHHTSTPLHLAFSCWVFNQQGLLLLTRRALTKKAWPGVWTNSVCGHPQQGEAMAAAIARRCRYETGLEVSDIQSVYPEFRYRAVDSSGIVENEICPVFAARAQNAIAPRADEVSDYRWLPLEQVLQAVETAPWALSPWMVMQASHPAAAQALRGYQGGRG